MRVFQPLLVSLVAGCSTGVGPIQLEEPSEEPPSVEGLHVRSSSPDEVRCISAEDTLFFTVAVENQSGSAMDSVVLLDTLNVAFGNATPKIELNTRRFPGATVSFGEDELTFQVELGRIPEMEMTPAYSIAVPAANGDAVYCNKVTAVGKQAGGEAFAEDQSCVTETLVLDIDLSNEDGEIVSDGYEAQKDTFRVGDGGPVRPDALVFEIGVENRSCDPLRNVRIVDRLAPVGIVEFRKVLPGFPTLGGVSNTDLSGLVWEIDSIAVDQEARLLFRAEAVRSGQDVNRLVLTTEAFTGEIVNEESVTVIE